MAYNDFQAWLIAEKKMQRKSASDVASRYGRALRYISRDRYKNADEAIFAMTQNNEYKKLSMFIRSQLKRAIRLYYDYVNNRNSKYVGKLL